MADSSHEVLIQRKSVPVSINSNDYGPVISKVVSSRGSRSVSLFDVNQLLAILKNILPSAQPNPQPVNVDDAMVEAVRKVSCKLACSFSTSNIEQILEEILHNDYLSKYDWDVTMVTMLASFASNYAAFRVQSYMQVSAKTLVVEIDKGIVATVEMIEQALKLMNLRKDNKVQVSTSSSSVDYVTQVVYDTIHIVVMGSSLITGTIANNEALTSFTTITTKIKTTVQALSAEIKTITEKGQIQKVTSKKVSIYEAISEVVSIRDTHSVGLSDVNKLLPIVRNTLPSAYAKPESVNVDTAMVEAIRKLSSKLPSNSSTVSNIEEILQEIHSNAYLSKYGWDVTMVTMLASFASNYVAFRVQSYMQVSAKTLVVEIDKGIVATVEMIEQALKLMNLRKDNKVQVSTSSSSVDYVTQAVCDTIHIVVMGSSLITGTVANNEALTSFTTIIAKMKTTVQALSVEIKTITEKGQIQKVISKNVSIYEAISKVVSIRGTRSVELSDVNKLLPIVRNTLPSAYAKPESVNVDTAMIEAIRKLSSKLPSNSSTVSNIEEILQEIHSNTYLSKCGWDVMMVTVLASFGTKYAAFRMQSFMQASAEKVVVEIDKGMVATVEMIENALKLMNLPEENKMQVEYVTQAVCNTIHIVVMGSSLVTGTVTNTEALTSVTTITAKIKTTVQTLSAEIETITETVERRNLINLFYWKYTPTIAASLHALIKPDPRGLSALVTCNNNEKVSIEQIKGENIYLVITGDDSSKMEILYLAELMKKQTKYQLIFIPMSSHGEGLYGLQLQLDWYTVRTRSLVRTGSIKFIREFWWFKGKTIVVRLGQKGPKPFSIDWICAMGYFPAADSPPLPPLPNLSFTYLLRDIYRPKVRGRPGSITIQCLYGGDSIRIESFIQQWAKFANTCSRQYETDLDFIYISKSMDTDNDEIFNQLNKANFGSFWKAKSMECWCFWSRVETFFDVHIRLGTKGDTLTQAATLSHNGNVKYKRRPWIVFGLYPYPVTPIITEVDIATVAMQKLIDTERLSPARFFEALEKKIAAESK